MKNQSRIVTVVAIFAVGYVTGSLIQSTPVAEAQSSARVFELRTYTTNPGKLDALHSRFRHHTMRLFERHGMTNVGYFSPQDEPLNKNTLIYLLAHDSREAAAASWQAFVDDPEWQQAFEDSRRDGPLIESIDSVYMDATDYSQME